MVSKTDINVFSAGKKETVSCNVTLTSLNNSHNLNFDSEQIMLSICLRDVVDLQDFYNLLKGKEKKNILHCTLSNGEKEYKGLRKVLFKNKKISVSLGGIRVEFNSSINDDFIKTLESLKSKMGI
ncbi:hypothetical protein HN789_07360 [archaeon]|jgi:hypothetical protein|nr:hypothetical protein [archaeon]MBT4021798.1 hypothetical protein [archaeon]MBT4271787.1 hypothetical protein [archaeon]MBT4460518.1 hypothetical protein [archaeon]MBT4858538.1 hypothetical protein [archaeon]